MPQHPGNVAPGINAGLLHLLLQLYSNLLLLLISSLHAGKWENLFMNRYNKKVIPIFTFSKYITFSSRVCHQQKSTLKAFNV